MWKSIKNFFKKAWEFVKSIFAPVKALFDTSLDPILEVTDPEGLKTIKLNRKLVGFTLVLNAGACMLEYGFLQGLLTFGFFTFIGLAIVRLIAGKDHYNEMIII